MIIDLDKWTFESPPNRLAFKEKHGKTHHFDSAKELCEYISQIERIFQNRIAEKLKRNPVYKAWKKRSPRLKDLPHFRKYRESKYSPLYHLAARRVASGASTPQEKDRFLGLSKEILNSPILLQKGQKLFHGMEYNPAIHTIDQVLIYKNFFSCTLCPEVAAYHAIAKGNKTQSGAILILEILEQMPAIFGARGKLEHEQELLLKPGLKLKIVDVHNITNGEFHIIEGKLKLQ